MIAPVAKFPGYLISDDGVVYSERMGSRAVLSQATTEAGYPIVAFNIKGKQTMMYVHRLIAEAFIPNPKGKRTINHKNGIKSDNRIENLEWATYSENNTHAYRVLNKKAAPAGKFGFDCHHSKPVIKMDMSGAPLAIYGSSTEAAKDVGSTQGNICSVCRKYKYYKTAAGFRWRFATEEEIKNRKVGEL